MPDLNYELAPKQGMLASQRKAELDGARFIAVRNLAYMIYKKPDGAALKTYQETLDDRELVKAAIINHEIGLGLLQNDLGAAVATGTQPQMQMPQMSPTNGAQMSPQPNQPQMQFQQPMQGAPQAPMPPGQFAQVPVQQQPQFQPPPFQPQAPQPQFQQPQQQYAPQAPQQQMQQPPQQQYAAPQQQMPQQQMQQAPAAPPMEGAPVTGKKRKAAAGNSVAPPPVQQQMAPPGFAPQQAAVPVQHFAPQQAAPGFQQPQMQAQPQIQQQHVQQVPPNTTQSPAFDLGPLAARVDQLGKGIEISANNGDAALKAVTKLQGEVTELKLIGLQILTSLHHLYLNNPALGGPANGQATTLNDFRTYLGKFLGNPS